MSDEHALLKQAFEQTPPFFKLLSQLRSRRVGKGYTVEAGKEEVHPATGFKQFMEKGPLAFESRFQPQPLSETEEALLAWAACGPNGIITADLPANANLSTLLCVAGSTIPGPCNDSALHLLIINDEGTHLYKRSKEREKPVEIESEADYPKVLRWYQERRQKISDKRPALSWSVPAKMMGIWQWNYNKPGSTVFIPVQDMAFEQANLLLSLPEWFGWYFVDADGTPSVSEQFCRDHNLNTPVPLKDYEELCLHASDYVCGFSLSNMRLGAEALGLGAWIFCGYSEDLVLGGIPEVSKGLGFHYNKQDGKQYYVGLRGVIEGYGYPAPWWRSVDELIEKVYNARYNSQGIFFGDKGSYYSCSIEHGPYKPEVRDAIRSHPRVRIPDWCVDFAKLTVKYFVEKYGRWPVYHSALHQQHQCQFHHVDTDFYDKFHLPGYMNERIRGHDANWHNEAGV
jgi:hypothetical protein